MTTPINSTPINSSPMGCMHNGLPDTSIHDIIEHIGNFRFGDAVRDMTDPRSPIEVNFGDRTVEQTNTPTDKKDT